MPTRSSGSTGIIRKTLLWLLLSGSTTAFTTLQQRSNFVRSHTCTRDIRNAKSFFQTALTRSQTQPWTTSLQFSRPNKTVHNNQKSSTCLHMYNLPPGKNDSDLSDLAKLAGTLVLVVAFFVSPLGGIVLGIFNSFLLLTILLPIMGGIGITVWQYFNTMTGNCPSCGAPVRVLKAKDGIAEPSICFSCGSILQANYDNSGIDNITGRNTINDISNSPFGGSLFDIFGGGAPTSVTTTTTSSTVVKDDKGGQKSKIRRESTIIDVEVDNDEPWQ